MTSLDLVEIECFVADETCERLVAIHRRFGRLGRRSENALGMSAVAARDPEGFVAWRSVTESMRELAERRFGGGLRLDAAFLCAIAARGFTHPLHADNARVVCVRHPGGAEALVRAGCACEDVKVVPNHTPWRRVSALLYLSSEHAGGSVVFGEGPNRFGTGARREIPATRGRLVLFPSDERYFHRTTPVTSGVRYSMSAWFRSDVPPAPGER